MSDLYDDHMSADGNHKRFQQLREQKYKPEYIDQKIARSESKGHCYEVGKVRCLNVPFAEADVSEDEIIVYLCGCDDHWFNRSSKFEEGNQQPEEIGKCKHVSQCYMVEQAKQDDKQTQL